MTKIICPEPGSQMTIGSITFAPDQSKPCYSLGEIIAQAETERLRVANVKLLKEIAAAREGVVHPRVRE